MLKERQHDRAQVSESYETVSAAVWFLAPRQLMLNGRSCLRSQRDFGELGPRNRGHVSITEEEEPVGAQCIV